jgi:vacuolar-type H+-ATPase subunit H
MEQSHHQEQSPHALEKSLAPLLEMQRQQVISSIKEKGLDASMELIGRWCDKAEAWVEESREKTQRVRRMIILNFAKYDFYIADNDVEGARECAKDAIYMAKQEGCMDLVLHIENSFSYIFLS